MPLILLSVKIKKTDTVQYIWVWRARKRETKANTVLLVYNVMEMVLFVRFQLKCPKSIKNRSSSQEGSPTETRRSTGCVAIANRAWYTLRTTITRTTSDFSKRYALLIINISRYSRGVSIINGFFDGFSAINPLRATSHIV